MPNPAAALFRPASRARRRPELRAAANASGAPELFLYDEIGIFGIMATDVLSLLAQVRTDELHVRINSPGGDVMEGVAIYNALRRHAARVITHVDALAASIASLIMLAGDEVRMAETSFLMVHNASGITIGTAEDHRQMAETLDRVNDTVLIANYMRATGQKEATVRGWLDAETWFPATDAVTAGFADIVEAPLGVEADFDLSIFRHPPDELAAASREFDGPAPRVLERALRDAGLSGAAAKAVLAEGLRALERTGAPMPRDVAGAEDIARVRELAAMLAG